MLSRRRLGALGAEAAVAERRHRRTLRWAACCRSAAGFSLGHAPLSAPSRWCSLLSCTRWDGLLWPSAPRDAAHVAIICCAACGWAWCPLPRLCLDDVARLREVLFHTAPHPAGVLRAIALNCDCDHELPPSCGRSVVRLPCMSHKWPRCSIHTPKRHPPGGTRQIAAGRHVPSGHCRTGRGPPAARRARPARRRPVAVGGGHEPAAVGRRAVVACIGLRF